MTMRRRDLLLSGLAAIALAGCGFHPVYAPGAAGGNPQASAALGAIQVERIPERFGQLVRQDLQSRFEGTGAGVAKRYDLEVVLNFTAEGENILPDNSSSRIRYIATATYTLRDQTPARGVIVSGHARQMDAANVIRNQYFATDLETETITRRLSSELADQITLRLAEWFRTHPLP